MKLSAEEELLKGIRNVSHSFWSEPRGYKLTSPDTPLNWNLEIPRGIINIKMASMDDVERVKHSARVRKGRGFGDARDSERLNYESIEDSGGPGPMRLVCGCSSISNFFQHPL